MESTSKFTITVTGEELNDVLGALRARIEHHERVIENYAFDNNDKGVRVGRRLVARFDKLERDLCAVRHGTSAATLSEEEEIRGKKTRKATCLGTRTRQV